MTSAVSPRPFGVTCQCRLIILANQRGRLPGSETAPESPAAPRVATATAGRMVRGSGAGGTVRSPGPEEGHGERDPEGRGTVRTESETGGGRGSVSGIKGSMGSGAVRGARLGAAWRAGP